MFVPPKEIEIGDRYTGVLYVQEGFVKDEKAPKVDDEYGICKPNKKVEEVWNTEVLNARRAYDAATPLDKETAKVRFNTASRRRYGEITKASKAACELRGVAVRHLSWKAHRNLKAKIIDANTIYRVDTGGILLNEVEWYADSIVAALQERFGTLHEEHFQNLHKVFTHETHRRLSAEHGSEDGVDEKELAADVCCFNDIDYSFSD